MVDYQKIFDAYCRDKGLALKLSFEMPEGFEGADGMFDPDSRTVYINTDFPERTPDAVRAFFLLHELRHAAQYLRPEQFSDMIRKSLGYVIQYDGTCYKLVNGEYLECCLEGGEERFTNLYAGQPHEKDANTYAYEAARKLYGDSEALRQLYESRMPKHPVTDETYAEVYAAIDEKTAE